MFDRKLETAGSRPAKWRYRKLRGQRPSGAAGQLGFERLETRIVLSAATLINEIDINCPSKTDNRYMYVELEGTPGASLNNLYFVAFQSGGNAEFVQNLSGYSIGADGLAVIKSSTGGFSLPAATTLIPNDAFFTDSKTGGFTQDTLSFYLFSSPTAFVQGTDYDSDNNGTLDHLPTGATVLDHVASLTTGSGDLTYGGIVIQDNNSGATPDAVTRVFGNTGTTTNAGWFGGELDDTGNIPSTVEYDLTRPGTNMPTTASYLTPGMVNYPVPAGPTLTPSGSSATFTAGASPLVVDSGITLSDPESTTISSATVTTSGFSEDAYGFTTSPTMQETITQGHNGQGAVNVITLTGLDTVANYQAALRSITYQDTTLSGPALGTRSLSISINDGITTAGATETVKVTVASPVVTAANPSPTFTLFGSAATVDGTLQVSSLDANITGASLTITNYQSGDTLNYSTVDSVTEGTPVISGGSMVVPFTGNVSAANYQAALRTVTFSTSGTTAGTRTIDVVATDSTASPTTSNTGVENVTVVAATIGPPVVTAHQSSVSGVAGTAVTVDGTLTVTSPDTFVTGATITLGSGYTTGDTLNYATTAGVTEGTPVISGGSMVVPFTGNVSAASYQAALRTVTFSNTTNNALTTRNVTIAVQDSNDTGNLSDSDVTQIAVSAPVTVSQLYVNGSTWTTFDAYLGGNGYGSATLGYALKTGSSQLTTLPWSTINEFDVQFSGSVGGPVSGTLTPASFKLVGGTGGTGGNAGATPTISSVTSLGGNAYQVNLSGSLGYNDYILAVASTSSSFGTPVTDANGAGISGQFTTSSSTFPSGNGFAGSTFDFQIDVLPGDSNQNGTVNSQDNAKETGLVNDKTSAAGYNPYVDINANGTINSQDNAVSLTYVNDKASAITAPNASSATQVGTTGSTGSVGFTALALGSVESGSSSGSSSATTAAHGRHKYAATDEAAGEFDLADLWI